MLLTFLYMVATVMKARTISFLKMHLYNIFKGDKKCSSIMLYIKFSDNMTCLTDQEQVKLRANNGYEHNKDIIHSNLCLNNDKARLGELLWYQGDVKLCTIYPQQEMDISDWLAYPNGKSLFPLNVNNCCQILNASEHKIHIHVEANLEIYKPEASNTIKLENYGLITTWTTRHTSINFILETDIDHIISLIIAAMQEQYYINNGLLLTRIQSLLISGKPCIYNSEYFDELSSDENTMNTMQMKWDMYVQKVKALSSTAQMAFKQKKSIEVVELPGVSVHPPNQDLNTKISTSSTMIREDDDVEKYEVESAVTPLNTNTTTLSEESLTAINAGKESDNVASLTQSHCIIKRENNKLSNTDSKISTESQSKSAAETINAASMHRGSKKEVKFSKVIKPPNIVIYADSPDAVNNVKAVLEKVLEPDRYVIYALAREAARSNVWLDQVALAIICGNVDSEIKSQLVEYVIQGGKLLALCSDLLHTLLPSFKTAEVRENELVRFSYGKWKHVRMMHHIFCYHASPIRTRFSHEDTRTPTLNPPASTNVKDKRGNLHSFNVKVLGTEETWHNPSILLATLANRDGKVVFSQIHLEVDPTQYEYEEDKFNILKENNAARLEIISDLLSTHLGMEVNRGTKSSVVYTSAYFLGTFEKKQKMIEKLKSKMQVNGILKLPNVDIQFCTSDTATQSASASFLPIMVHRCPANFSTVKYFETLRTNELGRLVIYADVLLSSMNVTECQLQHGLVVIPRQQTKGKARGQNIWLSPMGCTMFTLQMHIPEKSHLGSRVTILQHFVATAIIFAIRSKPGYEDIDIRLKWPNDIYANTSTKIGGLFVHTQKEGSLYICNIGVGINLFNTKPTVCINDIIQEYNQKHGTKLQTFLYEEFLAEIFNNLEKIMEIDQQEPSGNYFRNLYQSYWLHEDSNVTVIKRNGESEEVRIVGIDDFGYLLVEEKQGKRFTVHPDGNTFDLLKGLIAPK